MYHMVRGRCGVQIVAAFHTTIYLPAMAVRVLTLLLLAAAVVSAVKIEIGKSFHMAMQTKRLCML